MIGRVHTSFCFVTNYFGRYRTRGQASGERVVDATDRIETGICKPGAVGVSRGPTVNKVACFTILIEFTVQEPNCRLVRCGIQVSQYDGGSRATDFGYEAHDLQSV